MWYLVMGSSPLTRGKLVHHRHDGLRARLIPAHAGKTRRGSRPPAGSRAHPHSRRENNFSAAQILHGLGSSPLTRGKQGSEVENRLGVRLIPTHAGKTFVAGGWLPGGRAHPRSRGENLAWGCAPHMASGSSPLSGENYDQPVSARERCSRLP